MRYHVGVELQQDMVRHIDAGLYKKVLQKYLHESPTKPQHSPYIIAPKKYGKEAHNPLPPDESAPVSKEKIKRIQGIVGSLLFYAISIDSTFLVG